MYNIALISGYVQMKNLTADNKEEAFSIARIYLGAWAFIHWDFSLMCKINRVIVSDGSKALKEYKTAGAPVKPVVEEVYSSMGAFPEDSKFWYPRG